MRTLLFPLCAVLGLAACGEQNLVEHQPPASLVTQADLLKNYLGAPDGETLPFAETFSFGPQEHNFASEAEAEAYATEARAFGARYFAAEIEARLLVRNAASASDALTALQQFVEAPEDEQAAKVPAFVREQAAAYAWLIERDAEQVEQPSEIQALTWAVDAMQRNHNGSVIELAAALDDLRGTWPSERLSAAAQTFAAAYKAGGTCETCLSKAGAANTGMSPMLPRHLAKAEDALTRLQRF